MKNIASAFLAAALLVTAFPAFAVEEADGAYRYVSRYSDGWPKWIGRVDDLAFAHRQRPELAAKYLPLSLVKTGGFQKLVKEVMETPGAVTSDWPSWIGEADGYSY